MKNVILCLIGIGVYIACVVTGHLWIPGVAYLLLWCYGYRTYNQV